MYIITNHLEIKTKDKKFRTKSKNTIKHRTNSTLKTIGRILSCYDWKASPVTLYQDLIMSPDLQATAILFMKSFSSQSSHNKNKVNTSNLSFIKGKLIQKSLRHFQILSFNNTSSLVISFRFQRSIFSQNLYTNLYLNQRVILNRQLHHQFNQHKNW